MAGNIYTNERRGLTEDEIELELKRTYSYLSPASEKGVLIEVVRTAIICAYRMGAKGQARDESTVLNIALSDSLLKHGV